jgi:D-glycero-alpha-D-manno-heptose-7-phosphate kinase
MGDIPTEGSGLGSSSTVTVGALHAMHALRRRLIVAEQLAREACEIELDVLGKPIGIQDQYIAAYGGLRFMEFNGDGAVTSKEIELNTRALRHLNESFLLFFTGMTRKAEVILAEQKANIDDRITVLCEMKAIAHTAYQELEQGRLDEIGRLLHESWQLKKRMASQVSNSTLDNMYETARKAGAVGGKISGAGGGGFLLLYCPQDRKESVRDALAGLQELPFRMGQDGSKVIFDYQR